MLHIKARIIGVIGLAISLSGYSVTAKEPGNVRWFPEISTGRVKNFVPNSSFECGAAGWGGWTYDLKSWAGNLFQLEGECDSAAAWHGGHSLKITLDPVTTPVFHYDYFDPIVQPIRRVLAANKGGFGWTRVNR